jgi:hypothetical protein
MSLIKIGRLIFSMVVICLHSNAQSGNDQKKSDISSIVQSKNYSFMPQSATTNKGKTIQLSGGGYGLKLMNDSLIVYLPYYGRAYNAGYQANSNSGVEFNSHAFTYSADSTKKQGWEITIKPKGVKVTSIFMSISASGYCSVRVSSNDRDPISYYGTIKKNSTP